MCQAQSNVAIRIFFLHSVIMSHSTILQNLEVVLLTSIGEPLLDRVIAELTRLVEQTQKLPADLATNPKAK
jgi:MoaA/NifB/PqqE/SkfB family radical SAM enzyme